MGFPVGYTELILPRFVIHIIFLLGHIRKLIIRLFDIVGLGDLLDSPDISSTTSPSWPDHHHRRHGPKTKPLYAVLIQDLLPVVKYQDLGEKSDCHLTESCAVCLFEFEDEEEIRRLSNCRHVFHKCCLDPWVELDQRTCPLCRTHLVPEEMREEIERKLNPFARDGDRDTNSLYYYDDYYDGDYHDDSFGFVLPSQAEPFSWLSSSSSHAVL